jgi:poly(A) polymerase
LLTQVAPERIHQELYAILEPPGGTTRLRFLDSYGLFTALIPEFIPARGMLQPELHHWDVLEHSLETVGYLEHLATLLQQPAAQIKLSPLEQNDQGNLVALQTLLREAEEQHIFAFDKLTSASMKLAALLHDIGKTVTYTLSEEGAIRFYGHPQAGIPLVQHILHRMSGSVQERRLAQQVAGNHMRPGQLSRDQVTTRAIRRYFVDLGPTGIYIALISLADHLAMRGPEPLTLSWERHLATVRILLNTYIRERERIIPPRLIQPDELIRRLDLTPGPIIGQLLEAIAEAQTEGKLHSKDEALWLAEEILQHQEHAS